MEYIWIPILAMFFCVLAIFLQKETVNKQLDRFLFAAQQIRYGMSQENVISIMGDGFANMSQRNDTVKIQWQTPPSVKPQRKITVKFINDVAYEITTVNMDVTEFCSDERQVSQSRDNMVKKQSASVSPKLTQNKASTYVLGRSVTGRIQEVKQPYGGYLPVKLFEKIQFEDGKELQNTENIHASIIGMAVDYLSRFIMGAPIVEAFIISEKGAVKAEQMGRTGSVDILVGLLSEIRGDDNLSIINACKAVTFDVWFRNAAAAPVSKTYQDVMPDEHTIQNIRILIRRCIAFWEQYGPITKDGFTFGPNGYTQVVCSGDGDFLTKDTLWDLKVSKTAPNSKHTLQLLMYWIMGNHSGNPEFLGITKLGIFNPRLNRAYLLNTDQIPKEIIAEVETQVICYK